MKLVKAHMSSSTSTAAGPKVVPEACTSQAATQAAWRFFNNERITLDLLSEPLREAGRIGCAQSQSDYVLLAHDWSKLKYAEHGSKSDLRQITHDNDLGYELTTSLLVDASSGAPLAPMQMMLRTGKETYSTSNQGSSDHAHRLDQLHPTMEDSLNWELPRHVVHVIDREADCLGRLRSWEAAGHLFLVRCKDRRVLCNGESYLISELANRLDETFQFEDAGEVVFRDQAARLEVAQVEVVLHRPHSEVIGGKKKKVTGEPIGVRLVLARVVDEKDFILAQWSLLTNVISAEVECSQIAKWYYYRWRIESFFKLLKSHGQQVDCWQQETGLAVTRRLLVASMACVVIWHLQRNTTPQAEEFKEALIQLSGRRMKRGKSHTAPALLAGYFNFLAMTHLLEHSDYDLRKLKSLAKTTLPFLDST